MNLIVAVDRDYGIGKNNSLLFSIPEDMKYFRETTYGKTVVMGYNTLKSFPGGKPLKGRRNIVLSRSHASEIEGAEVCRDIAELGSLFADGSTDDVFVIGGASVYELLLGYCDYAYITEMDVKCEADCFFPALSGCWSLYKEGEEKEYEGVKYRFNIYKNSSPKKL